MTEDKDKRIEELTQALAQANGRYEAECRAHTASIETLNGLASDLDKAKEQRAKELETLAKVLGAHAQDPVTAWFQNAIKTLSDRAKSQNGNGMSLVTLALGLPEDASAQTIVGKIAEVNKSWDGQIKDLFRARACVARALGLNGDADQDMILDKARRLLNFRDEVFADLGIAPVIADDHALFEIRSLKGTIKCLADELTASRQSVAKALGLPEDTTQGAILGKIMTLTEQVKIIHQIAKALRMSEDAPQDQILWRVGALLGLVDDLKDTVKAQQNASEPLVKFRLDVASALGLDSIAGNGSVLDVIKGMVERIQDHEKVLTPIKDCLGIDKDATVSAIVDEIEALKTDNSLALSVLPHLAESLRTNENWTEVKDRAQEVAEFRKTLSRIVSRDKYIDGHSWATIVDRVRIIVKDTDEFRTKIMSLMNVDKPVSWDDIAFWAEQWHESVILSNHARADLGKVLRMPYDWKDLIWAANQIARIPAILGLDRSFGWDKVANKVQSLMDESAGVRMVLGLDKDVSWNKAKDKIADLITDEVTFRAGLNTIAVHVGAHIPVTDMTQVQAIVDKVKTLAKSPTEQK